jgi:hypothetical protein
MKKTGIAGNTGKGRSAGTGTAATNGRVGGGQKRSRPAKGTLKTQDDESEKEDNEKEAMPEPEDESEDEPESPTKRTKVDSDEDPGTVKKELA